MQETDTTESALQVTLEAAAEVTKLMVLAKVPQLAGDDLTVNVVPSKTDWHSSVRRHGSKYTLTIAIGPSSRDLVSVVKRAAEQIRRLIEDRTSLPTTLLIDVVARLLAVGADDLADAITKELQ